MKTLIFVMILALIAGVVMAQTVTERVDLQDGKATCHTTYIQGLPMGVELWAINWSTNTPTYRIGVVRKATDTLRIGGYFATKAGQSWINPRVVATGKVLGGNGKLVIDEYEPITTSAKRMVTLSDAYLLYQISKTISLGPGLNGSWTEHGATWLKGDIVLTAKVSAAETAFVRWNCVGGGSPDSVRTDWSHKF